MMGGGLMGGLRPWTPSLLPKLPGPGVVSPSGIPEAPVCANRWAADPTERSTHQDSPLSTRGVPQNWGSGALCWSHMQIAAPATFPCVARCPPSKAATHWDPSPAWVRGQTPQGGDTGVPFHNLVGQTPRLGSAGGPFPAAQTPGSLSHTLAPLPCPSGSVQARRTVNIYCQQRADTAPPSRCGCQVTHARSRHDPGVSLESATLAQCSWGVGTTGTDPGPGLRLPGGTRVQQCPPHMARVMVGQTCACAKGTRAWGGAQ